METSIYQNNEKDLQQLEILRLNPDAILPVRAHPDDAGLDLYSLEDVILQPSQGKVTRTGIAIALAPGYVGLISDRSSLAKRGVKTAGGIIDAGYRGEIHIVLWNISAEAIHLCRGERIAQLLILPIATPKVKEVDKFHVETFRGDKGFGSTGR